MIKRLITVVLIIILIYPFIAFFFIEGVYHIVRWIINKREILSDDSFSLRIAEKILYR